MKIHVHTCTPNKMLIPATGTQQLWLCMLHGKLYTVTNIHMKTDKCIISQQCKVAIKTVYSKHNERTFQKNFISLTQVWVRKSYNI